MSALFMGARVAAADAAGSAAEPLSSLKLQPCCKLHVLLLITQHARMLMCGKASSPAVDAAAVCCMSG
jgi:hypothetical protein